MVYAAPLTPTALNVLFQQMTITALGLSDNSFDLVRVGWQKRGQPTGTIDEDVCYIRVVEDDDDFNRQRDISQVANDDSTVLQVTNYTRVWRNFWTFYGPNSFDRARIIRSKLFGSSSHDTLAAWNVYFVPNSSAPTRIPELFEGQWWERVDFSAQFNELVFETEIVGLVKSAEIVAISADGIVADVTISS